MVRVDVAAERFIQTLTQKLTTLQQTPPSRNVLRQVFLDWCQSLPIPEIKNYILSEFDTHLNTLYDAVTSPSNNQDNQNNSDDDDNINTNSSHLIIASSETVPYLSFSPQPASYIYYLQDVTSYFDIENPNLDLFFQTIDVILSPSPTTYSALDTIVLLQAQINVFFDFLVQGLPLFTNTLDLQRILSYYPQLFIPHVLNYFTFAYHRGLKHENFSTLSKAVTCLCLLVQTPTNTSNNNTTDSNDSLLWFDSLISSFQILHPQFDIPTFHIDLLTLWSHFILVPSLCSQSTTTTTNTNDLSTNNTINTNNNNNIADPRFTLLGQSDFELFQTTTKHSPRILMSILPTFIYLLPLLSRQRTDNIVIFMQPINLSRLLLIFSTFSHVATIIRMYSQSQYSKLVDMNQFKQLLIKFAKSLQSLTILAEGVMLPQDISNVASAIISQVRRTKNQNVLKKNRKKLAKVKKQLQKEKDAEKLKKDDNSNDSDGEDNNNNIKTEAIKKEQIESDDDNNDTPKQSKLQSEPLGLLQHVKVSITTVKDLLSDETLKSYVFPKSPIPLSRSQELILAYLHKLHVKIASLDDYDGLSEFFGGRVADLYQQQRRDTNETKRKIQFLLKKQRWYKHRRNHQEVKKITQQLRFAKQQNNPMSVLLQQLASAKIDGDDSDDDNDNGDDNTQNQNDNDDNGDDDNFEDETFNDIASIRAQLTNFNTKQDNGDDDDDDEGDDDNDGDYSNQIGDLISSSLHSFKQSIADDDDDFGDIEIKM